MSTDPKVLVVGAGPTGLTVAIELARRGVAVRIIEKRAGPSVRSKALVLHARTLELLDTIGVADQLVAKGYASPGIDFSASSEKPLRADMHRLSSETRFPYIVILPQAETEAALERKLLAEHVAVDRGATLRGFVEHANGVEATVERAGAAPEIVRAEYIVGADGPHSTVRQALGVAFEGSPYGWTAFLGDVTLHGRQAEGGTEQHASERGLAFIVPFEDGTHRIVTIDARYQGGPKRRDLDLAELQDSISGILGAPVRLSDPKWLTRWGAELKLAASYRSGRAFIAGDAAHTHSPAGGQGLNTGVQDAFNLGWKLAQVASGAAPASLLDTYQAERRAVGERVLRTSDLLLRSLMLRWPLWRRLREALFDVAIPLPPVQHALAMNLSGLGVSYEAPGGGLAGRRAPDFAFMDSQHNAARLYELLRPGGGLLLVDIEPRLVEAQRAAIERLIAEADARPYRVVLVLRSGVPARHRFDSAVSFVDYKGDMRLRWPSRSGARLILVRPDGYVGVEQQGLNPEAFAAAYAGSLAPPTTTKWRAAS